MKIFFKKNNNGRIRDLTFYATKIDKQVKLVVSRGVVGFEDDGAIIHTTIYDSAKDYINFISGITSALTKRGWKTDYYKAIENKFNTYKDGTLMTCKINQGIDSIENLTYPLYAHEEPKGFENVFFNGSYRGVKHLPSGKFSKQAVEIFKVLRNPFNCYLNKETIIVHDVLLLDTPYEIRQRLLTELEGIVDVVSPTLINTQEELEEYCKDKEDIVLIHKDSLYLPGFTPKQAYVYTNNYYSDAIVLETTGTLATCIDISFDGDVFTKEIEGDSPELRTQNIIKYTSDEATKA